MRIKLGSRESGNAMIVTLVISSLLGFSLASYLDLVSFQNSSTQRSLAYNSAVPLLEAGLEDALTQLYHNAEDLGGEDWNFTSGVYYKKVKLGDGYYEVSISTDDEPVILATAYIEQYVGSSVMSATRTVKVTTRKGALLAKGMVAKGNIDLSGNNVRSDSFDSADPDYSTGGMYDATKGKDNGDIATNSGLVNSFDIGNADIFGKVSTGPGGSISVGASGGAGSKAWHAAGNTGIQPGWSSDDMNVQFPDVEAPWTGGAFTPTGGNVDGTSYNYVVSDGKWELSSLSMSGEGAMLVTGDAILYVTGDVSLSGNAEIIIQPGGSLQLYVGGSSAALKGNGVSNQSGKAENFFYYGLNSNTSLSMGGNAAFTGVIYAPYADFRLGGGGSDTQDFIGASITASVKMDGHFNFHYDENLARIGPKRGFTVGSWDEVIGNLWEYTEL